jgi:hypothetical protein
VEECWSWFSSYMKNGEVVVGAGMRERVLLMDVLLDDI